MGPIRAVKSVFGKFATFRGVAPRSEYWWWALFTAVTSQVFTSASRALSPDPNNPTLAGSIVGIAGAVFALAIVVPGIAVSVRRFHDAGFSGKWLLLYAIPAISFILVAGTAFAGLWAVLDPNLADDQKAQALFALFAIAAPPVILSVGVQVFVFIITVLPSKSAQQGNKHTR